MLFATPVLGQSSLKSRRDFLVGDHPVGVCAIDYDGDGHLDLITVNQQTNGIVDIALVKGFDLPFVAAPSQGKFVDLGGKTLRIDQAETLSEPKKTESVPFRRPPKKG